MSFILRGAEVELQTVLIPHLRLELSLEVRTRGRRQARLGALLCVRHAALHTTYRVPPQRVRAHGWGYGKSEAVLS